MHQQNASPPHHPFIPSYHLRTPSSSSKMIICSHFALSKLTNLSLFLCFLSCSMLASSLEFSTSPDATHITPNTVHNNPDNYNIGANFSITNTPKTRFYNFTVGAAIGAPDGFQREMLVVNGQFPGPLIEANEGDTIVVNVRNTLKNGTAIHWHGIDQRGSSWADGVPGITQCPIPAGRTFTYIFTITRQYGTYWWHSHMGNTMTDGIMGPLVVHSPREPYALKRDYDYDRLIILGDWMHDLSDVIVAGISSPAGYRGSIAPPPPDALLINGVGVTDCSTASSSSYCTPPPLPELQVVPKSKYRIRIINTSSHVHYKLSIDNHPLKVIAADGVAVDGVAGVHQLPIGIAQRYDVIVDASIGNNGDAFFIRAVMCKALYASVPKSFDITAKAVFRYVTPRTQPSTISPNSTDWSDSTNEDPTCSDFSSKLIPYVKEHPPAVKSHTVLNSVIGSLGNAKNETVFKFFWNGVSWLNYIYRPVLFTVKGGEQLDSGAITHAVFNGVGGADIVVNNLDASLDHPYHLHGNQFFIMERGSGALTNEKYGALPASAFNTANATRRDSITIPRNSYAILRILTNNPGTWALHCHIGWHLAAGKMAAIVVQPDALRRQFVPFAAKALCDPRNFPPGDTVNTIAPGKRSEEWGIQKLSRWFRARDA